MMRDQIKSSLYELYPEIRQLGIHPVVIQKGKRFCILLFESMDCLKQAPPLSSCVVVQNEQSDSCHFNPEWEALVRRAVSAAQRKMSGPAFKVISEKFSVRIPGARPDGKCRMERRQLGGILQ